MKKLILIGLILTFLASPLLAAEGDIDLAEVNPDTAKGKPQTVCFYVEGPQAEVIYKKVDASGNTSGGNKVVTFVNTPAVIENQCAEPVCDEEEPPNCEDPICEDVEIVPENNEFDDLYSYIHTRIRAMDSLYKSIKKAVDIKLAQ